MMRRRGLVALAAGAVLMLVTFSASLASAYGPASGTPTLSGSPSTCDTSTAPCVITLMGTGYPPDDTVEFTLDGSFVASTTVNPSGAFSISVTVPASTGTGSHTIVGTDELSQFSASFIFMITTTTTPPPATYTVSNGETVSCGVGQSCFFYFRGFPAGATVNISVNGGVATRTANSAGLVGFDISVTDPHISIDGGPLVAVPFGTLTITLSGGGVTQSFFLDIPSTSPCPSAQPTGSPPGSPPGTSATGRQNLPLGQCQLVLSSGVIPAGSAVTVSGNGFAHNSRVAIAMDPPGTTLGHATTNSSGSFSRAVTIPSGTAPGHYTMTATGESASGSPITLAAYFTVPGSGTKLANATGSGSSRPGSGSSQSGASGAGSGSSANGGSGSSSGGGAGSSSPRASALGAGSLASSGISELAVVLIVLAGLLVILGGTTGVLVSRRRRTAHGS